MLEISGSIGILAIAIALGQHFITNRIIMSNLGNKNECLRNTLLDYCNYLTNYKLRNFSWVGAQIYYNLENNSEMSPFLLFI